MQRFVSLVALIALGLAGCGLEDPDGLGAEIIDSPAGSEQTSDDSSSTTATEAPATAEAESTATPPPEGTRQNPVQVGTTVRIGDWQVTVAEIIPDATQQVLQANEFNDEPARGRQYLMAQLTAAYVGEDSGDPFWDLSWKWLGPASNTFGGSMNDDCGVIPQGLSELGETFPGGTATGNLCIAVPSDQIEGGQLIIEGMFGDNRVFWAR